MNLHTADSSAIMQVAEDECRHHELLRARLEEMGSFYGAFPAHDALWDSAAATAHSLPARLAIEHCTHEARGLDVMPATIHKFRVNGDEATAKLLEDTIYKVCGSLDCCIGTSCELHRLPCILPLATSAAFDGAELQTCSLLQAC